MGNNKKREEGLTGIEERIERTKEQILEYMGEIGGEKMAIEEEIKKKTLELKKLKLELELKRVEEALKENE